MDSILGAFSESDTFAEELTQNGMSYRRRRRRRRY